jgi:hypothetical protein
MSPSGHFRRHAQLETGRLNESIQKGVVNRVQVLADTGMEMMAPFLQKLAFKLPRQISIGSTTLFYHV